MDSVAPTLRRTLALVLLLLALPLSTIASAQDGTDSAEGTDVASGDAGFVEVLEVSGLLDDVLADAIEEAVRAASADGLRALVLQVNSRQAVVSDERLAELATLIDESPVPVVAWVGPSGSRAAGRTAQLLGLVDQLAVAPGAKLGPTGDQALDADTFGEIYGDDSALLADTALNWDQAIEVGVVPCDPITTDELGRPVSEEEALVRCAAPTVGDFLVSLESFDSRLVIVDENGIVGPFDPADAEELAEDDSVELRREPLTQVRFRGLSLLDQLMHTIASPPVAYLMLVIGLALIVFEFYSIGIGVAGLIGAVFLAFGGYGLAVLPVRWWAVALIVGSMLAFMIDVQQAIPRAWTFIGMAMFVVGTLFVYSDGDVSMSWIPMLVAIVGIAIVMWRGMPIMVRGRFATSAIQRDFLVDADGVAVTDIGADGGSVTVRGVTWRAIADEPIAAGTSIRVHDAIGLDLAVEAR